MPEIRISYSISSVALILFVKIIYGLPCITDIHCYANAKCSIDKNCVCLPNYVQLNETTCAPLIGEYCSSDEQCAPHNSICSNNKCMCDINYSQRSNNKCTAVYLGQPCNENEDCDEINYAECSDDNKCVCQSNYIKDGKLACSSLLGGYCREDKDCSANKSICYRSKCQCPDNYVQRSNVECLPIKLDKSCINDVECAGINHSICSKTNNCICESNYFALSRKTCRPLLNGFCLKDEQCTVNNSICADKKCQCKPKYKSYANSRCITFYLNESCVSDIDCEGINYGKCSNDGKCACKKNYSQLNETTCAPLLDEFCTTHEECTVNNSVCRDNKCQCKFFMTSISNRQCIPLLTDTFCYNDNDCHDIKHTKCSDKKRCTCTSNYMPINNTVCAPLITGDCLNDNDCITENSFCLNNTCQCRHNYRARSYVNCEKALLGDSCYENSDCEMIRNARCSNHNKKCICNENTLVFNETSCIPKIGQFCSKDNECVYDHYHCFDKKCQCLNHYLPVSENQCVPAWVATECNNDTDCGVPWHWECSKSKRCSCKANNTAISSNTCLPLIGGYCWRDDQCVVDYSFCIDFHCRCEHPYIAVANNFCKKN